MTKERKILLNYLLKQYKQILPEAYSSSKKGHSSPITKQFHISAVLLYEDNLKYKKDDKKLTQLLLKNNLSEQQKILSRQLYKKLNAFQDYASERFNALVDQVEEDFTNYLNQQKKYVEESLKNLVKSYK